MSPRGSSSSSSGTPSSANRSNAPYSRRPAGQPKSSRQQFSACGACRMRRVRCDLKDLPIASVGPLTSCSNCKERGLKCVDEFADVKAVKLLRRGRRLQQVEAIYGKVADIDASSTSSLTSRLPHPIPHLQSEFFSSPFWRWFSMQRPILDPSEFPARFYAHGKGTQSLGHEGGLLAMLLVVWAASFGIDERGHPVDEDGSSFGSDSGSTGRITRRGSDYGGARSDKSSTAKIRDSIDALDQRRRDRKEKTDAMLKEVLELIDFHGVMRSPTWDGVRVLLLILPLLEDSNPLDRLTMSEATLLQANSLCTLVNSSQAIPYAADESVLRARIFWYAHMQEGITTGMRGGRFVLSEDDLEIFQNTLPPFNVSINGASGLPSPSSPSFPAGSMPSGLSEHAAGPSHSYLHLTHLFSVPLHLNAVCRKVHAVLTGTKAARRIEESGGMSVDAEGMREVWDGLERCWEEFEGVRRGGLANGDVDPLVERFVSAWQIFIFECHNTIREALKTYASHSTPSSPHPIFSSSSSSSPQPSSHSPSPLGGGYLPAHQLYAHATRKCLHLLPAVLHTIERHLSAPDSPESTGLFKWDTGLVRDGVFFAGFLTASLGDEASVEFSSNRRDSSLTFNMKQESSSSDMMDAMHRRHSMHSPSMVHEHDGGVSDIENGVHVCLTAIREMRWAFSKSDEREENVRRIWEDSQLKRRRQNQAHHPQAQPQGQYTQSHLDHAQLGAELDFASHHQLQLQQQQPQSSYVEHAVYAGKLLHGASSHHHLPPLSLVTTGIIDSAPNTAGSTDSSGANGWPSYTPPGTGTSATSTGTGISGNGSPVFPTHLPGTHGFKSDPADDTFYQMEQFNFNPSGGGVIAGYHQARSDAVTATHAIHHGPIVSSGYLDFTSSGGASSLLGHPPADDVGCAPFVDGCNSFYQ